MRVWSRPQLYSPALELSAEQLRAFDGTNPAGRIFISVQGTIYDVSDKGRDFYGPGEALRSRHAMPCMMCRHQPKFYSLCELRSRPCNTCVLAKCGMNVHGTRALQALDITSSPAEKSHEPWH